MDDITQQAVSSALSGDWQKAEELNELILKDFPDNVGAMVRLAKAQIELGESSKAKKILEKVIKLDPYNSIATKTLLKLKSKDKGGEITHNKISAEMFLEEPGKTKLTELTNLGDPNIFLQLDPGDEAKLIGGGRTISVNTSNGKHVGKLPVALGFRIKNLTSQGFEFQALIKSTSEDSVKVFIRELSRPSGFEKIMPFPIDRDDMSDTSLQEAKYEEEDEI